MRWRGALGHGVARSGAGGPERRRARLPTPSTRRRRRGGAGALYGCLGGRRPCGPVDRPTAKDGGETGKAVCGPRPGTPVDAEVDLDVIWRLGSLPAVRQRIP